MIKPRGFTLVEVMVLSVVSLFLIGLLAQVFIVATKKTEDSRLRVDLQQTALVILRQFERDIGLTSARAIAVSEGENYVLSMALVGPVADVKKASWNKEQALYIFNSQQKTLKSKLVVFDPNPLPGTSPKPYLPTSVQLQNVVNLKSEKDRELSSHVEEFALTDRNGQPNQFQYQPLILNLKLRRPLSTSERTAEFTVKKRYALRNSF